MTSHSEIRVFGVGLVALLAAGCVNVPREAGFSDVRQTVAERTGFDVEWNQGTDADKAVEARLQAMLQKELSAEQAVQIALLNNRQLQATFEDLMVAQSDLVSAGLLRNPVFDAEIRFPTSGDGTGLEMALVQDFIDLFYIPLRKRVAGMQFEAAKTRVAGQVLDLAGQVRVAFYELQFAQQTLEMRRQVLEATASSFDIARRLRAAGNIRELDLATERVLFEQSKLDVRGGESDVVAARERLNRLMGVWGKQTSWTAVVRLPDLPAEDPRVDDVERTAIEKSLDLGIARREIEASLTLRFELPRPLGILPDAELGVSAEREPDGEWAVGPAFSLPIPLFNQGQPAVAAAQARMRRAQKQYYAAAVAVRSHAREANDAVVAARDQAEYFRDVLLPLRQKIVDETQLQYNAMQVSPLQLLQAKQQQIDAGATYIRLLRNYWQARADLDLIISGRMASFSGSEGSSSSETPMTPADPGRGGH